MTAIKVLTLLGDGFLKLLQAKQGHSEKDAREAIKLLKTSNPDLFHWLKRITDEDGAEAASACREYEKLIAAWVEEAAAFQTGGDLAHLMPKIGDSTVLVGLKLGIAALRRERSALSAEALLNHPAPKQVADSKGKVYTYSREPVGCIVDFDSPSYPPEVGEFRQCAARGCVSCVRWLMEFDAQVDPRPQMKADLDAAKDDLWKHPTWEPALASVFIPYKGQLKFMEDKGARMIAGGSATARPDASRLLKDGELGHIANYARGLHAGQMGRYADKDEPYVRHLERVVKRCEGNDNAKAVAWLHDVVEDCPTVTLDHLLRNGIPNHIVYAVGLLTRPKGNHNYFEYVQAIRDSKNELAIAVKLADLQDHLARTGIPEFKRVQYEAAMGMLQPEQRKKVNAEAVKAITDLSYAITLIDVWQAQEDRPERRWRGLKPDFNFIRGQVDELRKLAARLANCMGASR